MDLKHDRVGSSEIVTAVVNALSYFLINISSMWKGKSFAKLFK